MGLNGKDGPDDVYRTVVAILDGHAAEVAEVAEDGTWVNVAVLVQTKDGGNRRSTQIAPAWHFKGLPVDHEHQRQIEPWPQVKGGETVPVREA